MNLPRITILVTSVGNPAFPTMVEELRKNERFSFRIIGTDIRPAAPGLYLADQGYLVSRSSEPRFIEELHEIIAKEKVNVLFPLSTIDQDYFSKRIELFDKIGVKVIVSGAGAIEIANNKYNLYRFLEKHDLDPVEYRTIPVQGRQDFLESLERPFVLKRDEGAGGNGTYIVSEDETGIRPDDLKFFITLRQLLENPDRYISGNTFVCEYLTGDEFSVDCLSESGKMYYAVVRQRHSSVGGLALESTVVDNDEAIRMSEKIIGKIGLSYINNLQFKYSKKGKLKLMEINPRIPGSIRLSIAAGADIINDALDISFGVEPRKPEIRKGTSFYRFWDGVIAYPEDKMRIKKME